MISFRLVYQVPCGRYITITNEDETIQHVWDNRDKWIDIYSIRSNVARSHFTSFYLTWCNKKVNIVWKRRLLVIMWVGDLEI